MEFKRALSVIKNQSLKRHRDLLSISILAFLTVIFLWRIVFLGQIMLPVDMIYQVEPWKSESIEKPSGPPWNPNLTDSIWGLYPILSYAKDARQLGEGFFWDPYSVGGMPAMARGDMFLNPILIILSAFLPIYQTLNWMAVIHLFLAGVFTYLLLMEMGVSPYGALIGGLVFAFNGYLIGWLALANFHNTAIWLPLILWGIERAIKRRDWRWTVVGALGFALQIVSGFILWPFYAGITLILFAIIRSAFTFYENRNLRASSRPILYTGLALGIGTLFAMPQLMPSIQLFLHTGRGASASINNFLDIKTHLIRLIAPTIYGNDVLGDRYRGQFNYPETSIYFGVLALFFIFSSIFAPKRRYVWGLFGIGAFTLLAVYNIFPFSQITSVIFPIFLNVFPGRIFYVVVFTWSIAAGLGADWLVEECPKNILRWMSLFSFGLSIIVLILWWSTTIIISKPVSELNTSIERYLSTANPDSLLIAAIFLLATTIILWGWQKSAINKRAFIFLSSALLVGDLFYVGINYNSTFDPKFVFPETPSLAFLPTLTAKEPEPHRVLDVNSGLIVLGMTPELYQLQTLSGYTSWVLSRYSEYSYLTQSRFPTMKYVYFTDCCHDLIDAMNVKYVYTSHGTTLTDASPEIDLINALHKAELEVNIPEAVSNTFWTIENQEHPVLYQHPSTRITYELLLEKPARLITAIAIDPLAWGKPGDGVLFEVHVHTDEVTDDKIVFSRYIDPKNNPSDQTAIPVQIDLSPYVDQNIYLSLVTKPGPQNDNSYDWAGWIAPKIDNESHESPLKLIYDGPNKIYENTEAFPRAWVVHQATRVAPNDIEAIKVFLQDPAHDLALEAVVEIDEPIDWHTNLSTESSAPSDEVGVNSYAPERVVIEAELETPGLLVLSDVMYPGWRAYVDGIERPILTTNLIMRSVYLEGGAHTVEFVFKPYVFMTGLAISTITIVIISVAFVLASKKRQPPDSQGFAGVVAEHPRTYHPEDSQRAGPQE